MHNTQTNSRHHAGFTLVELVMVIVLIGAISVGAASLFFSKGDYTAFVARGQLLSSALLAQQIALGNSASPTPASLRVAVSSDDEWVFTLTKTGQPAQASTQDAAGGTLRIDGVTLGAGASRLFTWDSDANLTSGTAHSIQFIAETTSWVCLSAAGFAYAGDGGCP